MKAIILAAGVGSRLRPLTDSVPKTLVAVAGKPILAYQVDALHANGVEDIVVLTGYLGDRIEEACRVRYPDAKITFIGNPEYDVTNNMYSLYLAREHITGDTLIMNADVCFEADAIAALLETAGSAVAVDPSIYNDESMKVTVEDRITDISKTISEEDAFGCSIDVYKFAAPDAATLRASLTRIIEEEGDRNQWTEVLLQRLFSAGEVHATACPVSNRWLEIDNHDDLNAAEKLFNERYADLASKKVFFFDRDGTLTLGGRVLDGAERLLQTLQERGLAYYVLTNNSSRTPSEHVERMRALPITEEHIVVSTGATMAYLKREGLNRILLSATPSVSAWFEDEGFTLTASEPQAVVLTYNDQITYGEIRTLVEAVRDGTQYFATHTDLLYPYEGGFLPDIGCLIEMIRAATGREPDQQFGKPSAGMISHVLERHGVEASEAVIVGDRLYTDIALAEGTGLESVLVLTGETARGDLSSTRHHPGVVLNGVDDLIELFG